MRISQARRCKASLSSPAWILDLSRWRVAYSGSEPIRQDTQERFAEKFAPCGFSANSYFASYGLAEATLMVSGSDNAEEPVFCTVDRAALERVACECYRAADTFRWSPRS